MSIKNPNVANRGDTTTFLGPIGTDHTLPTSTSHKRSFVAVDVILPNRLLMFFLGGVVHASTTPDRPVIGVSAGSAETGSEVDVILLGEASVIAGGAIASGQLLTTGLVGVAVPAAAGQRTVGVALGRATNAGELVPVMVSLTTA